MSEESRSSQSPTCPRCHNPVRPNSKFCMSCGLNLQIQNQPPQSIGSNPPPSQPTSTGNYPVQQPPQYRQAPPMQPPVQQQPPMARNYPGYLDAQYQGPPRPSNIPQNIENVREPLFQKDEYYILGLFILTAFFSHLLRYLLVFNRVPTLIEFIYAIPFYILVIIVLFAFNKTYLHRAGLSVKIQADRFDHIVSLILSTFFLSTISHRNNINQQLSTIPDKVNVVQPSKLGIEYVELPKMVYVGVKIRPKSIFLLNAFIVVLGLITLYIYLNNSNDNLVSVLRLGTAYLGGLAISDIAPVFGRHNKEMTEIGRFRTLLLFIAALFVLIVGLLGQSFFLALTN